MALTLAANTEPIPGYKLIQRLGVGGYGEVWKAQAPGGMHKAIKFVTGDLRGRPEEGAGAEQELQALNRVKEVRHPFILSLDRADVIEGQLIIVMELADRDLMDRFRECAALGLQGIPRRELLRYLEEAAEALDLINSEYDLLHLDVKPQNLFLFHNHVKVADFGLVQDLKGRKSQTKGTVTPLYAAPEAFEGNFSRHSDQYSLAIVYFELLTGKRPFSGANSRQLLMQHIMEPPDLSPLPEEDRDVIGRALAKKPEDRFSSCGQLVRTLKAAQPAKKVADEGMSKRAKEPSTTPLPATCLQDSPPPSSLQKPGIPVKCPQCGQQGPIPEHAAGKALRCRRCRRVFSIPVPEALYIDLSKPAAQANGQTPAPMPENAYVITCPHCGIKGRIPPRFKGHSVRCRACTNVFTVTSISSVTTS